MWVCLCVFDFVSASCIHNKDMAIDLRTRSITIDDKSLCMHWHENIAWDSSPFPCTRYHLGIVVGDGREGAKRHLERCQRASCVLNSLGRSIILYTTDRPPSKMSLISQIFRLLFNISVNGIISHRKKTFRWQFPSSFGLCDSLAFLSTFLSRDQSSQRVVCWLSFSIIFSLVFLLHPWLLIQHRYFDFVST